MRRLVALCLLLGVAACALPGAPKRTSSEIDKDRSAVADAIRSADRDGMSFHMTERLTLTGGDIPSGQAAAITATADGAVHDGRARFTYRIAHGRNQSIDFDVVLAGADIYIKPRSSSQWKRSAVSAATALFPDLRLALLRDTVLLASDVSPGGITTVNNGFAHRYTVKPAPDQLEELQAVPVTGQAEQAFLRTATAEVVAYLTMTGGKLTRIEVHLKGVDPSNAETQKVDTTADFRPSRVGAIEVPASSTQVPPSQILNLS